MASSIRVGLNCLSNKTEAFFICLADMPMVNRNVYNKLIAEIKNKNIIAPTFKGSRGNPILFSKLMKKEIMKIEGDIGAKKILELNKNNILYLEINDESIKRDFNTIQNFIF